MFKGSSCQSGEMHKKQTDEVSFVDRNKPVFGEEKQARNVSGLNASDKMYVKTY